MDIIETILKNKEHYYALAHSHYNSSDKSDFIITPSLAKNKSISLLLDHEFIFTPAIQIQLSLFIENGLLSIGMYTLYIDQSEENIIDEFLVII